MSKEYIAKQYVSYMKLALLAGIVGCGLSLFYKLVSDIDWQEPISILDIQHYFELLISRISITSILRILSVLIVTMMFILELAASITGLARLSLWELIRKKTIKASGFPYRMSIKLAIAKRKIKHKR